MGKRATVRENSLISPPVEKCVKSGHRNDSLLFTGLPDVPVPVGVVGDFPTRNLAPTFMFSSFDYSANLTLPFS